MSDLIALIITFIAARLDEDEREARAATDGPWRYNPVKQWLLIEDEQTRALAARSGILGEEFVGCGPLDSTVCVAATGRANDPQSMADARFIARHDPARALREIAAKRRLLAKHAPVIDGTQSTWTWFEGSESESESVLTILASVWSDHPDFREEWRA